MTICGSTEGFCVFASLLADASLSAPFGDPRWADNFGGSWNLAGIPNGDACLNAIRGLRKLRKLGTPQSATDEGLAAVATLPDLAILCVSLNDRISDKGIAKLAKCKELRRLRLWDASAADSSSPRGSTTRNRITVTAAGIRALRDLDLIAFDIPASFYTEECFAPYLDALREDYKAPQPKWITGVGRYELVFGDPTREHSQPVWPCTPAVFKAMAGKKGICSIRISGCKCDESVLAALGDIPDLESLELSEVDAQGTGLKTLAKARSLRKLRVSNCPDIGDEALGYIASAPNLVQLNLHSLPRVTNDGAMKLGACQSLSEVSIGSTQCTQVADIKLQKQLPKAVVRIHK